MVHANDEYCPGVEALSGNSSQQQSLLQGNLRIQKADSWTSSRPIDQENLGWVGYVAQGWSVYLFQQPAP